ncbi:putative NBD/HSP70 family sugar kinase [Arthrobacter sp. V4I6]|uniref:ROK family protein n=1 Tax=unclassified Arthrobacter TaxID=235627 RepID=UPI0027879027|nr:MULTISPECIES: ROK family protein [unclassified Arthrobacter]MDQ0819894.1 putative NBD/HSP70 family sugar kinase [Arthrobacter sp. V1I7]MDQ0854075.1 putative NBD/HSP70 family sugar kinase [Arthrobacter sp. V4I6]
MPQAAAATPQLLRRVNAQAVLGIVRGLNTATGTELMARTGLTRASVIAVCEDLIRRGWIRELDTPQRDPESPGTLRKGRPARRFELNHEAGHVLGLDIGAATTTAAVADLRGTVVARSSEAFRAVDIPAEERIAVVDRACRQALAAAGTDPARVLAAGAGIAAPVDRDGNVLVTQHFWSLFDVGLRSAFKELHGWTVLLENDANLAALGERWRGSGAGVDDLVVLLAGERLGAGVMESGRLLHGRGGAAGEMGYLDMLDGVGSSDGIASLARQWSAAGGGPQTGGAASARRVFEDAAAGDPAALQILDRISERMARVIASIASLINPEQVVIGGAVAESAGALLPRISALLPRFTATPPLVTVSPLGDSIVTMGAIRHALDYVEEHALELELPGPV